MNKRVIVSVAMSMLTCTYATASQAYTSPGWDKIEPLYKALPAHFGANYEDGIPADVAQEIKKISPAPDAPGSWKAVRLGSEPRTIEAKRRSDGLVNFYEHNGDFNEDTFPVHDPLGLIPSNTIRVVEALASLSLSAPVSLDSISNVRMTDVSFSQIDREKDDGVSLNFSKLDCLLNGTIEQGLFAQCHYDSHWMYGHWDGFKLSDKPDPSDRTFRLAFDRRFGMFFDSYEFVGDVVDWKIENQPWHSQQVSMALSAAQKDQARSLFARGFDLLKAGDFTGARAMVETALKIDPANYLGWFTLGEIGRSLRPDGKRYDYHLEYVAYTHTIDLAPDSPEAALAKGYLGGH